MTTPAVEWTHKTDRLSSFLFLLLLNKPGRISRHQDFRPPGPRILSGQLFEGRHIRILTVVGAFRRLSRAINLGLNCRGSDAALTPDWVTIAREPLDFVFPALECLYGQRWTRGSSAKTPGKPCQ